MEATGRYVIAATTTPDDALIIVYDAVGQPHTPLTAFVRTVIA